MELLIPRTKLWDLLISLGSHQCPGNASHLYWQHLLCSLPWFLSDYLGLRQKLKLKRLMLSRVSVIYLSSQWMQLWNSDAPCKGLLSQSFYCPSSFGLSFFLSLSVFPSVLLLDVIMFRQASPCDGRKPSASQDYIWFTWYPRLFLQAP